jgi:hypothetical protein
MLADERGSTQFISASIHVHLRKVLSQIDHVHIRSEAHVVGEIEAVVIGIVIDHDVIAVPEPVAAIAVIIRSNLKEATANIEAVVIAAAQPPYMLRADAGGETSMFPGTIHVIVNIIAAAVVSNPAIVLGVDVRSVRMAFLIAINGTIISTAIVTTVFTAALWCSAAIVATVGNGSSIIVTAIGSRSAIGRRRCLTGRGSFRAAGWNVSIAHAAFSAAMRLNGLRLAAVRLSAMLLSASLLSQDQG